MRQNYERPRHLSENYDRLPLALSIRTSKEAITAFDALVSESQPSPREGRGRGPSRTGGWPRVRARTNEASASERGGPLDVRDTLPGDDTHGGDAL